MEDINIASREGSVMGQTSAIQQVYLMDGGASSMMLPLRLSNCSASMVTKQPSPYNVTSCVSFRIGKGHVAQ